MAFTVYIPGATLGIRKSPWRLDTTDLEPGWSVMPAPGNTAPVTSLTVPLIEPLPLPRADWPGAAMAQLPSSRSKIGRSLCKNIKTPLEWGRTIGRGLPVDRVVSKLGRVFDNPLTIA